MPSNPKSLLAATRADNVHCNLWRRSDRKELKAYLTLNQTSPDTFSGEREEHLKREFALLAKCKFQVDTNTNELIAKVRIVLDGSRMIKGIHFTESYSPVISDRALKIIIHMCMIKGMRFYTTDIGNDYLRAEVDKDVRVFFPSYRRTKNGSLVRALHLQGQRIQQGPSWTSVVLHHPIPILSTTKDLIKSATRGNKTCTHHHEKAGSVGYITDEFRCETGYARSMIASHANDSTTADKTAILKTVLNSCSSSKTPPTELYCWEAGTR